MFEYKAVPFIATVSGRDWKSVKAAAAQLTAAIASNTSGGWEFMQLAPVNIAVRPGCLGGLFGGGAGTIQVDQLLFRRPMSEQQQAALSTAVAEPPRAAGDPALAGWGQSRRS